MSEEMQRMARQLKDNIGCLIERQQWKEAQVLLDQYLAMAPNDAEAYSLAAVWAVSQGEYELAHRHIEEGLKKNSTEFDLLYNQAYLCEMQEEWQTANEKYFRLKSDKKYSMEQQQLVEAAIERMLPYVTETGKRQTKFTFFVKSGMDSFIDGVIQQFSEQYETKKVVVTELQQIEPEMQRADICWFEWCDELVIHASRLPIAMARSVICRLHSYEAFTDYPKQVNWSAVDKVVFVAQHIRDIVLNDISELAPEKAYVIPNGVDVNCYTFRNRKKGYRVAYVGYINYKKGPMLLLHAFEALYRSDDRYRLHIAGQFQDGRDVLYFQQMIQEMGLENKVVYEGWQDDLDSWLEDKDYILCTSLLESQNMSVMQAMAKGIKPLIHNFVGAKVIYPKEYVWNTIPECVKKAAEGNFNSTEYRDFVVNNYAMDIQEQRMKEMLQGKHQEKAFDYATYWNNRLTAKFDIEGVGYLGLGQTYNREMYRTRTEILQYILHQLFPAGIKGKQVLELGPGIGMFTQHFHAWKCKYEAIDIAENAVKRLSKQYRNFRFRQGDVADASLYRTAAYDLVFAADVLLHLTDEEKYRTALSNIANGLTENGYVVLYDPITLINTVSSSPHVSIRSLDCVKDICSQVGLEIAAWMPTTYFMNNPFDKAASAKGESADQAFNAIARIFSDESLTENMKKRLAQWLATIEKECLLQQGEGFSQKVLVLKKSLNATAPQIAIQQVWQHKALEHERNKMNMKIQEYAQSYPVVADIVEKVEGLLTPADVEGQAPTVTIGVTIYNGLPYLKECVDSVLNQTYPNVEILLIDNGSTDGSQELIRKLEKEHEHVRGIFHVENSGGPLKGIKEIPLEGSGEYYQWLCCDDTLEPDAIEQFASYLTAHPGIDYVYSDLNIINGQSRKTNEWKYEDKTSEQIIQHIFHTGSGVIPMFGMHRKSFLTKHQIEWHMPENDFNDFSAEMLTQLQFLRYGWKYEKIDKAVVNYRIHETNDSHNIHKRIKSSVVLYEYIIENFPISVYFPDVPWKTLEHPEQFKNVCLAYFYLNVLERYVSGQAIPRHLRVKMTENELHQMCVVYLQHGRKYLAAALKQGEWYRKNLEELKKNIAVIDAKLAEHS